MRPARWIWPIPGRLIVAGCMWVLAFGRIGLYRHATGTLVADDIYAILLALLATGLILTEGRRSLHWTGRTVAALGAGILAGLGTDILAASGYLSTSSMMVFWLSLVLIVQAGARREC